MCFNQSSLFVSGWLRRSKSSHWLTPNTQKTVDESGWAPIFRYFLQSIQFTSGKSPLSRVFVSLYNFNRKIAFDFTLISGSCCVLLDDHPAFRPLDLFKKVVLQFLFRSVHRLMPCAVVHWTVSLYIWLLIMVFVVVTTGVASASDIEVSFYRQTAK